MCECPFFALLLFSTLALVISLLTIATAIVIYLSIANAAWCWKSNEEEKQRIDRYLKLSKKDSNIGKINNFTVHLNLFCIFMATNDIIANCRIYHENKLIGMELFVRKPP